MCNESEEVERLTRNRELIIAIYNEAMTLPPAVIAKNSEPV